MTRFSSTFAREEARWLAPDETPKRECRRCEKFFRTDDVGDYLIAYELDSDLCEACNEENFNAWLASLREEGYTTYRGWDGQQYCLECFKVKCECQK